MKKRVEIISDEFSGELEFANDKEYAKYLGEVRKENPQISEKIDNQYILSK